MGLRYDEIAEILKVIDSSSCDEFVLETEEIRLVVRRRVNGAAADQQQAAPQASSVIAPAPAPAAERATLKDAPSPAPTARHVEQPGLHVVRAPMVGTFYRSPSPGAPAFVEVGSAVRKGEALCIIEVMKLFTTIHAEQSGTIVEIGAENATLVEYGQMLFVMKPE